MAGEGPEKETSLKLFLFDLDGTIMLSGGTGMRAMSRAFKERLGVKDAFRGIAPDGKTDPMIFREIFANNGLRFGDEKPLIDELAKIYERYLREEMPISEKAYLMPGIVELLESLSQSPGAVLGLLTGNFEATARIKLSRFDLNRFFPFGAYASDSDVRSDLVPIAVERAEEILGRTVGLGPHVVVIGDTPRDVQCALDNGVTAVGVASLKYTTQQLTEAGAHLCFENFSDTAGVVAALEAINGR